MYVLTADFEKPDAAEIFTRSLKETGFGVLKNHPVNYQLVKDVFNAWEDFFTLPDTEKNKFLFDKEIHDGFFPMNVSEIAKGNSVKDIKEYYHFYPWGRCPESLREKSLQLFNEMTQLAMTLLGWVEQHTPEDIRKTFSMPLSQMIKDAPRTLLRILHYPPLKGTEEKGAIRAADHEDINLLTLLPAATATGLQVKDVNNHWHEVESDPGTLV
ncbi:MAG: 2-oxoglutarate and iron-dependent oxygenase domain-containing protein, partial [Gammaproteobacteria bacterium]|nr:2-oxoglutarate and iron-dependent oxygenase domain-containing protein [Gammaproteobacteria bacterium]